MEFTELKVKVTTLNKSLFNQLRQYTACDFESMPEIIGWVNQSPRDPVEFIILCGGKVARMSIREMRDLWMRCIGSDEIYNSFTYSQRLAVFTSYYLELTQIFI